jgi:hypothetical protein
MRVGIRIVTLGLLLALAPAAEADVTGSFEGQYAVKKQATAAPAAATFTQVGKIVDGTIVIGGDAAGGAGVYVSQFPPPKATAKKLTFKGASSLTLVRLTYTGKIKGDSIKGKLTLKGPGVKRSGTLTLTKNPPLGDGASCDSVYNANQAQFATVNSQVLSQCTQCHSPGFQAKSTRFQVSDALSTARSVATLVDSANPTASLILTKPTNAIVHGGSSTLVLAPGSDDETKLRAWVELVAAAACK